MQTLEILESELFKVEDAQFVKLKGLITRLIIRLGAEVSHISDCNEETSMIDEKKENPEVDDTSSSTMFTSPQVIDEAGLVSMRLTLDESKNMETDRAKSQDTSDAMYDPKGINIHEDTLEEPKTDTAKGPNSVDSKGLNCQDCKTRVHINKQSPDIAEDVADGVHVNKGDLDDISAVPQRQISILQKVQEISQLQCIDKVIDDLVVQVPQTQIVEKTVEHGFTCGADARLLRRNDAATADHDGGDAERRARAGQQLRHRVSTRSTTRKWRASPESRRGATGRFHSRRRRRKRLMMLCHCQKKRGP